MDVDLGQLREPCACGMEHNIDVEKIVIESGAVSQLEEILEEFQNPVFICDSNTRTAAEPFLEEEFKDYPVIELNPEGLQADNRGVNKVMKQLDYCDRGLSSVSVDVLVAIGGGTIHDLTRYAATEYDCFYTNRSKCGRLCSQCGGTDLGWAEEDRCRCVSALDPGRYRYFQCGTVAAYRIRCIRFPGKVYIHS